MSSFEEKYESLLELNAEHGFDLDEGLIEKVAKGLGPALYNDDAQYVAATDDEELATVKENFIEEDLGVVGEEADAAIEAVCEKMSDLRMKPRGLFYALLVVELGKEEEY